ncbi:MAG TPA: hypothetical protein VGG38_05730 [Acidimicrobiales bacterium]|jgi:hypothetical protein
MKRHALALGLASLLSIGGGTGLILSTYAGWAGADSTTTTTTTGPTTSPSDDSGSSTSGLGGFTINALAEAYTVQYEQPNLPIPATPSLELDTGYASATDNYGPTGSATASTFYPGQVIANIGPELALIAPGAPIPPAPVWPLDAITDYPQTPNTTSLDEPGINMDAVSNANGSTATTTIGDDAATAGSAGTASTSAPSSSSNPLAGSSSLIGIGTASGTSSSTTTNTDATASASATDLGISLLAGFVNIGAVTSTATATSDGTTGTVTGSTQVTGGSIAGEAISITANGISAASTSEPLALPISTLNSLLKELGITIAVTNAVDTVSAASAARTLDGLQISINLDTLDDAVNKLAALLPAKLTSSLPIALPNEQVITIDLGTVTVASAASPSFSDDSGSSDTGTDSGSTGSPGSSDTGSFPSTGVGSTGSTDFGGGTTSPTGGTSTTPTGGTGSTTPPNTLPASTPAVFKGVGSGLVALGVIAALLLALAYKRADDVSELVGSACTDGDPLGSRFFDEVGDESGGFT